MIAASNPGMEVLGGPISAKASVNSGGWNKLRSRNNDYDTEGTKDAGINRSAAFDPKAPSGWHTRDMSWYMESSAMAHALGRGSGFDGKPMSFDEAISKIGEQGWSMKWSENFDLQQRMMDEDYSNLRSLMVFDGLPCRCAAIRA